MGICKWFLLCKRKATRQRPHPVLGMVPICKRCDELLKRIERADMKPKTLGIAAAVTIAINNGEDQFYQYIGVNSLRTSRRVRRTVDAIAANTERGTATACSVYSDQYVMGNHAAHYGGAIMRNRSTLAAAGYVMVESPDGERRWVDPNEMS